MGKKVEYKRERTDASDGEANYDVELDTVRNKWKLTLQHISAEDETNDFTELKLGYKTREGREHWWVEEIDPKAGRLYWMSYSKVLQAGDVPIIRFTGTTIGDVIKTYVDGYEEFLG